MADHAAAADAVLEGFVPIGDHPRVREFEEAVAEEIARRPSPAVAGDPLAEVNAKLDKILSILEGGVQ